MVAGDREPSTSRASGLVHSEGSCGPLNGEGFNGDPPNADPPNGEAFNGEAFNGEGGLLLLLQTLVVDEVEPDDSRDAVTQTGEGTACFLVTASL